jgi:uncharacterized protein (TIGR03067 family)
MSLGAPALKPEPTAKPTIVGEWTLESIEYEGRRLPMAKTTVVFFADGTSQDIVDGKPKAKETYQVNAATVPAELDWYEDEETVHHSIWKMDGDTLIISHNTLAGEPRPTSFTSPAGSNWFLLTLKRIKKKD